MTYTRAEVAHRAGIDPAFVDRLCDLGLLTAAPDGFTEGDVRRARILQSLGTAGMPLDAIGEGVRRGIVDLGFVDDPAYALFTGLSDETFAAAASRTGVPFEGYTRLTEERGDAAAADLAARLSRLVQKTSGQHGGKPVKWLGDGVMFHFRDPGPGVVAALEMVDGAREAALPAAHVGLHSGPVLFQEGDYFGRTVNVAARIADYARQNEVLVSDDVVAASEAVPGIVFEAIGPVELKGLTETVSVHVARRSTS